MGRKRRKRVPRIFSAFSLLVTECLRKYADARERGELPAKEAREAEMKKLLKGLPRARQAELVNAIDTFEAVHGAKEARSKDERRKS